MDESQLVGSDVFLAGFTSDANTTSPSQTHERNATVPRLVEWQTNEQDTPPVKAGESEYSPSSSRSEELYIQPAPFGDQSLSITTPHIFSTSQASDIHLNRWLQPGSSHPNPSTGRDYSQVLPSNGNPFTVPNQAFSNSEFSGLRNYDTNASNHSMSHFQPPSISGEGGNQYLRAQRTYASYNSPIHADNSQSSDHQSHAYASRSPTTPPFLPNSHQYHAPHTIAQGVYSNNDLRLPGGTASPFPLTGMPFPLVNPSDYAQSFSHPSLGVRYLHHAHNDQSNIPAHSAWIRAPQVYGEPGHGYSGAAFAPWTVGTQSPHNSLGTQPYNRQIMFASQGQFYDQMGAQTAGSSSVHSSLSTRSTDLLPPLYTPSHTGNPLQHGAYPIAQSEPAASYSNTQDHQNSLPPYKRSRASTLPDDYGLADVATYIATEEQNDSIPKIDAVPEPPSTHGPVFRPAPGTVGPQDMWTDDGPHTCPFPECNAIFSRDEAQAHFNSVHLAGELKEHSQYPKKRLLCTIEPCRRGTDGPIQLISMWRHLMTHAKFRCCCSWDGCNLDYAQDHAASRHFREMHWGWPNGKTPPEFQSLGGSSAMKKRKRM
ncbi:hypothetical protein FIBSPDRAFT_1045200 [Athelia psychrophila]|uniref:Uncharacterized protein n=1 Tax=Athelia psychrophila TaxID=1759441 RepID=A0A166ILW4_9AGAM|nr:hypothetical protein FIBSPDRAFT_1045200 [Fibularhizoctonia sp. CBS 109695]